MKYNKKLSKNFIQAGNGFVGIHAAASTEYDWPWYTDLVGCKFGGHPQGTLSATIDNISPNHPTTRFLPKKWKRVDEWYNFKTLSDKNEVLLNLDERTYSGGKHGNNHPIAWVKDYDGGRMFYTAGGHSEQSFQEPLFLKHILEGIRFVLPDSKGRQN